MTINDSEYETKRKVSMVRSMSADDGRTGDMKQ